MPDGDREHEPDFISLSGRRLLVSSLWHENQFDQKRRRALYQAFKDGKPFPHLVIDGLFGSDLLELIAGEFSAFKPSDWLHINSDNESTRRSKYNSALKAASNFYFATIHSRAFVEFLTDVTGVDNLIPDPNLLGGGLHEVRTGDWFGVHVDFALHSKTRLNNELVLITYLNKDWKEDYGGALELWDAATNTRAKAIVPLFGRTVILKHGETSLHGHTEPVKAPDGRPRRSVAAYYYSNQTAVTGVMNEAIERGSAFYAAPAHASTAAPRSWRGSYARRC